MSRHQYRITVNASTGPITDDYPGQYWDDVIGTMVEVGRVKYARLERRLVTDYEPGIEQLYPGIHAGELYISRWDTIAELES